MTKKEYSDGGLDHKKKGKISAPVKEGKVSYLKLSRKGLLGFVCL